MRVLLVHNRYQQPGGEDTAFTHERRLLERFGHEVVTYERSNSEIASGALGRRISLGAQTFWSWEAARAVRRLLATTKPEFAFFVNTFPLISPSVYRACRDAGTLVLQSIHNYRHVCPGALLHRSGSACEDCVGKVPWRGVVRGCYRNSRVQTALVAGVFDLHRRLGTFRSMVDGYLALTGFARDQLVRGGLPPDRIFVRPNYVDPDPGPGMGRDGHGLYVGRLTEEKGVEHLLAAWRDLPEVRLTIIGDGPLASAVRNEAQRNDRIRYLGLLSRERVLDEMARARFLVFPSTWYEGMPLTIIEALARGLPIVATALGSLPETLGDAGVLVPPGDPQALAASIRSLAHNLTQQETLRTAARHRYLRYFTGNRAYERLLDILNLARGARK